MVTSAIRALIAANAAFRSFLTQLRAGQPVAAVPQDAPLGLLAAARPACLATLHAEVRQPTLVVVARADTARALTQQIQLWSPHPEAVLRLPDPDALPYERVAWGRETVCERIRVLTAMAAWPLEHERRWPPLVVTSTRGLMQPTIPPADLRAELHSLRVDQRVVLSDLLARWLRMGYRPATTVEEPGTFSRRGGIVDIFPPHRPDPVRIELFGDEIESLRTFSPLTQRSENRIERFRVTPAHEALAWRGPEAIPALRALDFADCLPATRFSFDEDLARLEQGEPFRGIEFYIPYLYPDPASPLDYLPPEGLLLIEDPLELSTVMGELAAQAKDLVANLTRQGELPRGLLPPTFGVEETLAGLRARRHWVLGHAGWSETPTEVAPLEEVFGPAPVFGGQIKRLVDDLLQRQRAGARIVLASRQAGRLAELLAEREAPFAWGEALPTPEEILEAAVQDENVETIDLTAPAALPRPGITLVQGSLAEGWILSGTAHPLIPSALAPHPLTPSPRTPHPVAPSPFAPHPLTPSPQAERGDTPPLHGVERGLGGEVHPTAGLGGELRLILLTDAEIFGVYKPEPRRRSPLTRRTVTPETFLSDLQPGDYVVHVEHGIGIFQGLVTLNLEGVDNEYLQVDYAAHDRLYVPIHQADRLSRYVGVDDRPPTVHRLGTAEWSLIKRRTKRAVEEVAEELLEIYAAREIAPGHAFAPDTPWQQEMENSFPYIETEDQLRAIEQVKRDMERDRPMDRLICGDVGYGKTEVALRAAFKAVMSGYQVALLVPTTVLAQQHYQTFAERLAPYPVIVEMLSRFRSRKEQATVLEQMAAGKVDIVIGTHRLLQKDVRFKALGLVIVDEEQRFGVSHKERLKKMRTEVDVLTLTATPIPRTLYMSLSGVRDMSTIDTPPAERLAIKTTVSQYDETMVRTAILREMDRGGQVYFVHNRVMGIDQLAQRIAKIVPEARVAVAHGQMPESQLERVMMDFVAHRYDVLVCTSIIESGLDIPNANTIIINQAHRFGLAQLYQLRGRVGRGAVRAYAYLLTPRDMEIGEMARKRLESIAEASDLGAGFRIAMRDLEIRGAGDILGARQHGHIAAVGFDLYTRLLAQAVRELRNGRQAPGQVMGETLAYVAPLQEGIQISLPLRVYLPPQYVPDAALRLRLYRRMASLLSLEEVEVMGQELADRFGELPEPVTNLLYQLRLKVLALESGVQSISVEAGQLLVKAEGLETINREALQRHAGPAVRVSRRQVWLPLHPNAAVWQAELERLLRLIHRMVHDPGR